MGYGVECGLTGSGECQVQFPDFGLKVGEEFGIVSTATATTSVIICDFVGCVPIIRASGLVFGGHGLDGGCEAVACVELEGEECIGTGVVVRAVLSIPRTIMILVLFTTIFIGTVILDLFFFQPEG